MRDLPLANPEEETWAVLPPIQFGKLSFNFFRRVIDVNMGEYAITDGNSRINRIGTTGAACCIGTFIRRPPLLYPVSRKSVPARGAVLHFDAITDENLSVILNRMVSPEPLEISLVSKTEAKDTIKRLLSVFSGVNAVIRTSFGKGIADAFMDVKSGVMEAGTSRLSRYVFPNSNAPIGERYNRYRETGELIAPIMAYDGTSPKNDMA
jgi:hypothetical protein